MKRGFFSRRDRAEILGIGFTAAFIFCLSAPPIAISAWVSPEDIELGKVALSGPCPYKVKHGVPCTSCGLTRGFAAMSRGRLRDALAYNALTPWLYVSAALAGLSSGAILFACAGRLRQIRRQPTEPSAASHVAQRV